MMGAIFNEWINHFLLHIGKMYGISSENWHILIMDGHNSCVTLDVAHTEIGLNVSTIPNHVSHAMQPLNESILKPFKMTFRTYWDL